MEGFFVIPAAITQLIDNKTRDEQYVACVKLVLFYEGTRCASTMIDDSFHNCLVPWSHDHLIAIGSGELEYIICEN